MRIPQSYSGRVSRTVSQQNRQKDEIARPPPRAGPSEAAWVLCLVFGLEGPLRVGTGSREPAEGRAEAAWPPSNRPCPETKMLAWPKCLEDFHTPSYEGSGSLQKAAKLPRCGRRPVTVSAGVGRLCVVMVSTAGKSCVPILVRDFCSGTTVPFPKHFELQRAVWDKGRRRRSCIPKSEGHPGAPPPFGEEGGVQGGAVSSPRSLPEGRVVCGLVAWLRNRPLCAPGFPSPPGPTLP